MLPGQNALLLLLLLLMALRGAAGVTVLLRRETPLTSFQMSTDVSLTEGVRIFKYN